MTCAAIAACSAFERKKIAETPFEAGSVKLSLISVAPWEEIYPKLLPKFKLSGDKALDKIIPGTARFNRRQLDALAFGLSIGSTAGSIDAAALVDANADTPKEDDSNDDSNSSSVPVVPDGLTADGDLSKEPIIEYKAAATLFQEVQLLNEYLNYASIPKGYTPYLIRLQLAVLPLRRDQPFDIFTDLSFFGDQSFEGLPKVVPLVVTDSLESARENELNQIARSISLLAEGTSGGTPFESELQRLINRIEESETTDFNSLFTVSQVSDNSVRIRLGARYDGGNNQYEMTARTHNISLLVNVPPPKRKIFSIESVNFEEEYAKEIRLLSSSSMRDARNGSLLEEGIANNRELNKRISRISQEYFHILKDKDDPFFDEFEGFGWTGGEYCLGRDSYDKYQTRMPLNDENEIIKVLLYRYAFYNDFDGYSNAVYCMTHNRQIKQQQEEYCKKIKKNNKDSKYRNNCKKDYLGNFQFPIYDRDRISEHDEHELWSELSKIVGSIPRDFIDIKLPDIVKTIGEVFIISDTTKMLEEKNCCRNFSSNGSSCRNLDGRLRFINGIMTDDGTRTTVRLPLGRVLDASRFQLSLQLDTRGDSDEGYEFMAENIALSGNLLTAKFPSLKAFKEIQVIDDVSRAILKAKVKPNRWHIDRKKANNDDKHDCQNEDTAYIEIFLTREKDEKEKLKPFDIEIKAAPGVQRPVINKGNATFRITLSWKDKEPRGVAVVVDNGEFKSAPSGWEIEDHVLITTEKIAPKEVELEIRDINAAKNMTLKVFPLDDKGKPDKKTVAPASLNLTPL